MKQTERRYHLPGLAETLAAQGRYQRWVARKVGVSESLLSLATDRKRTVSEPVATQIAELLGVPFTMLCELHTRDDSSLERTAA